MKEVYMLTLECLNVECLTRLRIGRNQSVPITRVGEMKFCPICGGKAFAHIDTEADYWEALERSYEIPAAAIRLMHTIWDSKEEPSFHTFAKKKWEEIAAQKVAS